MKKAKTNELHALVSAAMTCGDCSGFNRDILLPQKAEQVCSAQGRLEKAKVCNHFRADAFSLRDIMMDDDAGDKLVALMDVISEFDDKHLRVMAGLLLRESQTRRFSVSMGDPVFVRYRGRETRNYVNNFYAARVLDVDGNRIRVISEDGTLCLSYENNGFSGPSVYSKSAFQPLMKKMKAKGHIVDPEKEIKSATSFAPNESVTFRAPKEADGFSVPKMDDVVKGGRKKRTVANNSLVNIVAAIENGVDLGSRVDDAGVTRLSSDSYRRKVKPKYDAKEIALDDL